MRFGSEDTDNVYDTSIKTAIRSLGFTPVRIDRKNHNDYIDRRILQEIDNAHLAVVDLTYARPSVYFEAGYAEAKELPVIYTVRSDHLDRFAEDCARVHFDLSMKNIIPWRAGQDPEFQRKLRDRLSLVSRPVIEKLDFQSKRLESRRSFSLKSAEERERSLSSALHEHLLKSGYKETEGFNAFGFRYEGKLGRYNHYILVHVASRFEMSLLRRLINLVSLKDGNARKYVEQAVLICENTITTKTIGNRLTWFAPDSGTKSFFYTSEIRKSIPAANRSKRRPVLSTGALPDVWRKHVKCVSVIDGCKSVDEILEEWERHLSATKRYSAEKLPG
jgi:hypothetical protein